MTFFSRLLRLIIFKTVIADWLNEDLGNSTSQSNDKSGKRSSKVSISGLWKVTKIKQQIEKWLIQEKLLNPLETPHSGSV